jgi:GNAT superfamily N-acetyltransferase
VSERSDPTVGGEYDEPARSYATLWFFVALLGVGFVIDLILGGGVAHLWGWVIAFVLVVGTNFILVYAVRSEKSLHLSAAELRVGDEAVDRDEIAAVATGIDETELPVLGWPAGRPRGLKGVTIRLVDGRDVVIPTRFPDRLRGALALDVAEPEPDTSHDVRAVARSELAGLPEIDERADAVFRAAGYRLPPMAFPVDALAAAAAVFVVGRPPIGFVWIDEVDEVAHVREIAVIPKWMGQGVGGRLLERACEWAAGHSYPAITLTTYADVPWNGPWYARRGFVESDDLTPQLAAIRAHEEQAGLDAVGRRIVMRRALP